MMKRFWTVIARVFLTFKIAELVEAFVNWRRAMTVISTSSMSLVFFVAFCSTIKAEDSVNAESFLVRTISAHTDSVQQLALSVDETLLMSAGADGFVRLWSTDDWHLFKTLNNHSAAVQALAFSADGKMAACGSADKTVSVWNALSWTLIRTIKLDHPAQALSFIPHTQRLAIGQGNGKIIVWDLDRDKKIETLKGHTGIVHALVCAKEGEWLFSISRDGVRVWSTYSWDERQSDILAVESLYAMQISDDGLLLGFGGIGKIVQIWNLRRWKNMINLTGHRGSIYSMAFSKDAHYAATGSSDKSVLLWDINTGIMLRNLGAHDGTVYSLAFISSKGQVVSASADHTIKIWDAMRMYVVKSGAELKNSAGETLTALSLGIPVTIEKSEDNRVYVRLQNQAVGWLQQEEVSFQKP